MKRKYAIALIAAVPALGLGITAAAEAATTPPPVSFTRISYNPPGIDNRSNFSLNGEYVRLRNNTDKPIQLKGWTLRDKSNHTFTFAPRSLAKGESVWVHTGGGQTGEPHPEDLYWWSADYIWNNDGDEATLKDAKNKIIDTCAYTSKNGGSATGC